MKKFVLLALASMFGMVAAQGFAEDAPVTASPSIHKAKRVERKHEAAGSMATEQKAQAADASDSVKQENDKHNKRMMKTHRKESHDMAPAATEQKAQAADAPVASASAPVKQEHKHKHKKHKRTEAEETTSSETTK